MRRNNLNISERIQREKVGVACDNVSRGRSQQVRGICRLRITTSHNSHIHLNPFSLARQSRQKASNIFLIYVAKELFPAQDLIELGESRKR